MSMRTPLSTPERDQLTATGGLAALALDAMASVAYGPEAIVLVLALAGGAGIGLTLPVALAIGVLLVLVIASYRVLLVIGEPQRGGLWAQALSDQSAERISDRLGAMPHVIVCRQGVRTT